MPSTRIDFGENLASPGKRQPNGTMSIDAFGLAQAQLTFAFDSSAANTASMISAYKSGIAYPDSVGFDMMSYKYHMTTSKGGVGMLTVDYMGIARTNGRTDAQITGVVTTTAQPIETHPNFTQITDTSIGTAMPIAGYYTEDKAHLNPDSAPLFVEQLDNKGLSYDPKQYKFNGFASKANGDVNIKFGVRQYLKPMVNIRGVIFLAVDSSNTYEKAADFSLNVGKTLADSDVDILIPRKNAIIGAIAPDHLLLTSANIELIGDPAGNPSATKVSYDIMVSGFLPWDPDIYGEMDPIF
jgi:hypothetical protein